VVKLSSGQQLTSQRVHREWTNASRQYTEPCYASYNTHTHTHTHMQQDFRTVL